MSGMTDVEARAFALSQAVRASERADGYSPGFQSNFNVAAFYWLKAIYWALMVIASKQGG